MVNNDLTSQKCKLFSFVLQLVYEAILSSARELGTLEDEEGNEVIDIPLVHVAHSRVQLRLTCFAQLVQVHPGLVPRLREIPREKESEVVSSCNSSVKKIIFSSKLPNYLCALLISGKALFLSPLQGDWKCYHEQIFWFVVATRFKMLVKH